jgi:predicted DNA-binding transcriptional regulator AlpA
MAECPFIRAKDVAQRTGYSTREVWRRSRNPDADFPRPRKLSRRVTVWVGQEVDNWIKQRIEEK